MQTSILIKNFVFTLITILLFSAFSAQLLASGIIPPNQTKNPAPAHALSSKGTSSASGKADRLERKKEKVQKFLKSKFGQWIIKQALKKAENRQYRLEKKQVKGDKTAVKLLKEKREKRFSMSRNLRLGLILVVIGLIALIITGSIFSIIGSILILVGLIFILLDLI
ncbi:MAG: hypothetical protein NW226_23195 [Microscillaceae bacterium]|nr:hypothetical protein [Microscillaceae bacterium]